MEGFIGLSLKKDDFDGSLVEHIASEFNKNIMSWVDYDNQIKTKNEEIKQIRSKKDNLEGSIVEFIQGNNLQDNVFNISSMDTQLQMNTTSVKETMSYKFLETTLLNYFNNDDIYLIFIDC